MLWQHSRKGDSTWVAVKMMVLFGYPKYQVRYSSNDPKRDHNFDNHPRVCVEVLAARLLIAKVRRIM